MPKINDYTHSGHVDRVVKGSKAKYAARSVLLEVCRRADHKKPETTFTKDQLIETTGYCRRTVVKALQELREEGVLVPIRNFDGGRGRATTYRIVALGLDTPLETGRAARKMDPREFADLVRREGTTEAMKRMKAYEEGD